MIFDKGVKNTHWVKDVSSINVLGKLNIHMQKNETTSPYHLLCANTNSKWINVLNVRRESMELPEENTYMYQTPNGTS